MPWLRVNQTRLIKLRAEPTPVLALDVQRGGIPGCPGAWPLVSGMEVVGFKVGVGIRAILWAERGGDSVPRTGGKNLPNNSRRDTNTTVDRTGARLILICEGERA